MLPHGAIVSSAATQGHVGVHGSMLVFLTHVAPAAMLMSFAYATTKGYSVLPLSQSEVLGAC